MEKECFLNLDKYKDIIKEKMCEKRYKHSVSVSEWAVKLALKYSANEKKAAIAGILHDITKEMPEEEQLKLISNSGINLSLLEKKSIKLLHSISGAIYVREFLKIDDEEIINAIKYHTTAREDMTLLEKIIFIADFLSDDRKWENTDYFRKLALKNLDDALIYGLKLTIEGLLKGNKLIAENTFKAYNYVILKSE